MHDLTSLPRTDPASIYRSRDQLYADDMLIAALTGLDFFSWLDTHPAPWRRSPVIRLPPAACGRDDDAVCGDGTAATQQ